MVSTITGRVEEAIELQEAGFRVFPLHWPTEDGCSCGSVCSSVGKHPLIAEWQEKASLSAQDAENWWCRWPQANIGVATGKGLVVVDLDSEDAVALAEELGSKTTVEVLTGRGLHLYFCGESCNRAGLYPGIDIRGVGGYVVAPPSMHASGYSYEWVNRPGDVELAELPAWAKTKPSKERNSPAGSDPGGFQEGERNDQLFRSGCAMRGIGMSQREILCALRVRNDERCEPPLVDDELRTISASAAKFEPNHRFDATRALHLGPHECAVYVALSSYANQDGICWPSYETLAEDTRICRNTVIKAVKTLEEAPLIDVERGGFKKPNVYTFLSDGSTPTTAFVIPNASSIKGELK